jgi:hypothetical protein
MKVWAMIGTGLLFAALIAALLVTRTTLAETKRDRDEAQLKLSVSNASIGTMQREIASMVAEQKALANSDLNRMNASRQAIQIADAVARVRGATIDKLNKSATIIRGNDPTGQCEASVELLGAWQ